MKLSLTALVLALTVSAVGCGQRASVATTKDADLGEWRDLGSYLIQGNGQMDSLAIATTAETIEHIRLTGNVVGCLSAWGVGVAATFPVPDPVSVASGTNADGTHFEQWDVAPPSGAVAGSVTLFAAGFPGATCAVNVQIFVAQGHIPG